MVCLLFLVLVCITPTNEQNQPYYVRMCTVWSHFQFYVCHSDTSTIFKSSFWAVSMSFVRFSGISSSYKLGCFESLCTDSKFIFALLT